MWFLSSHSSQRDSFEKLDQQATLLILSSSGLPYDSQQKPRSLLTHRVWYQKLHHSLWPQLWVPLLSFPPLLPLGFFSVLKRSSALGPVHILPWNAHFPDTHTLPSLMSMKSLYKYHLINGAHLPYFNSLSPPFQLHLSCSTYHHLTCHIFCCFIYFLTLNKFKHFKKQRFSSVLFMFYSCVPTKCLEYGRYPLSVSGMDKWFDGQVDEFNLYGNLNFKGK